ncbi:hypothetical protein CEXT_369691 [Caerostris extrusa]|uniref:Uncharacterized protein n=1 Tax=Caerostris extrusa TaxID=172846 RepID=A0AAV4UP22_CAEEX|nr:hypothetical protein CEXT_369691 [Caerostris extrusa]
MKRDRSSRWMLCGKPTFSGCVLNLNRINDLVTWLIAPLCPGRDSSKKRPPMRRPARTAGGALRPRRCSAFGPWTPTHLPGSRRGCTLHPTSHYHSEGTTPGIVGENRNLSGLMIYHTWRILGDTKDSYPRNERFLLNFAYVVSNRAV